MPERATERPEVVTLLGEPSGPSSPSGPRPVPVEPEAPSSSPAQQVVSLGSAFVGVTADALGVTLLAILFPLVVATFLTVRERRRAASDPGLHV